MRIVEVINEFSNRGGAEVFLASLSYQLEKNNELLVVSLFDDIHPSFISFFKEKNINFVSCHKNKGLDLKAAKNFKKIIFKFKPDIIHMHLSCLPTYFFAFKFKKRPWKLFETIHSIPPIDTSKIGNFFRKMYIKKQLITYIGISDLITSKALDIYKGIDCKTIFNGFQLTHISNNEIEKKYDFINVARFAPAKNHKLLFRCFSSILRLYPDSRLLCLGSGELFLPMKKFAKELNIENNVTFLGQVNDVSYFLPQAKCFVLSSYYEGNPISILEALSVGLYVIAPFTGGIPDVIKEENGKLFTVNSEKELTRCMLDVIENKVDFKKFEKANIEKSKKYDIGICANEYLNLFKNKT